MPSTRYRLAVPLLVFGAVLAIAASVGIIGLTQRNALRDAGEATLLGSRIVNAAFDGRDALVDYSEHQEREQLARVLVARNRLEEALTGSQELVGSDPELRAALERQRQLATRWSELVETALRRGTATEAEHARMDATLSRFQTVNERYITEISRKRSHSLTVATIADSLIVVVLSLLAAGVGYGIWKRNERRLRQRDESELTTRVEQRELAESLQIARGEDETYALLRRHLERSLPGSQVVVLNRDNSNDRLEPRTPARPVLEAPLLDASPDSCLAIRLGRAHIHEAGHQPLLVCGVCGELERATCLPSLVGGEVIGSVLIEHDVALDERERARVTESVAQAAPVLANLRNLALAETRAMTDALTGLSNARALHDTLKRMLAHAGRSASSLSLLLLDLDHFKQVNDVYGHEKGDEALAAVGSVLTDGIRASDFAARSGGEEFIVLLPDTDKESAIQIADKLRTDLEQISVPQLARSVTASFGVATYPTDAVEPDALLRTADRALYTAKASGRNTVHAAGGHPSPFLPETDGGSLTEPALHPAPTGHQ